ncbi:collagen alpha-6(VI) chain-like, partial [Tachysurus ichikawai]
IPSSTLIYKEHELEEEKEEYSAHEEYVEHTQMETEYETWDLLTPGDRDSNDVCYLKKDAGPCKKYVTKWFYDQKKNKCFHFFYGGCNGNLNRFDTQYECETRCVNIFK